jgi:hypothetical protein
MKRFLTRSARRLAPLAVLATLLAGCAHPPAQMYHWEGYQKNVYTYLKHDSASPAEQLQGMTVQADAARAARKRLPPGFHAHVAALMVQLGQYDDAKKQLEAEKADFPESAPYMDFLLKQMQGKKS